MPQAIKAGEAFLELSVHDQKFQVGLGGALKQLRTAAGVITAIGAGISVVGTAISGSFGLAAHTFAEFGNQLVKMSSRTGVGVSTLSEIGYAAEQSGVSLESLEETIKLMQRSLSGLGGKTKQTGRALAVLGLNSADLQKMLPNEQLETLLNALGDIQNPTVRAGAAMALFGRSGTQILPLIGHWKQLTAEAKHFNLVISEQSAKRAERLESAFGLLGEVFKALKFAIGDVLGDSLTSLVRGIAEVLASAIKWVKTNQSLVATLSKTGGIILGLGVALTVLGTTLPVLVPGFEGLIAVVQALGSTAFSLVQTALGALLSMLSFLVTPLGLVSAAVIGAVGALLYFSGVGGQIVKFLGDKFAILSQIAGQTFSAIGDALSGGDIGAAANVLWAGLKLAWLRGTEELRVAWAGFSNDVIVVMTNLRFDLASIWADIAADMKSTWAGLVAAAKTIGEKIGHALTRQSEISDKELDERIAATKAAIAAGVGGVGGTDLEADLKRLERMRNLGEAGRKQLQEEQDAAHQKAIARINDESVESKRKIAEQARAELAAIEKKRAAATDQPGQREKDIQAARDAAGAAQKAFDEARRRAAEARKKGFGGDLADDKFNGGAAAIATAAKGLTRSTFSGRLAPQIFGGGGPDPIPAKQLAKQAKMVEKLDDIFNAISLIPSPIRFGRL